jgi:enterochelin esterase-like enzyme
MMPASEQILSPRIRRLREDLENGDPTALESFWREVERNGTPLVEAVEADENRSLVTFVWRGDKDLRKVQVINAFVDDDGELIQLPATNLWYRSCVFPNDLMTGYLFSLNDSGEPITGESFAERTRAGLYPHDPYNFQPLLGENTQFPQESLLKLPNAPLEPWIGEKARVPRGQIEKHLFRSSLLKNERSLWVYTPPGYLQDAGEYPWLLLLDGGAYLDLGTTTILDNLIAAQKIPPVFAFFLANHSHATRHIDSSCNPLFARFLTEEMVPWLRQHYPISGDPGQAVISGDSYTGLSATFAAFQHPQIFGNVLAQSAVYFWFQGMDREPTPGEDPKPNWLIRQIESSEKLPLRFHLDVGKLETGVDPDNAAQTSILESNRHMHRVLQAKGYEVEYIESGGGHDFANWRQLLPGAIIFLTNNK